GRNGWHLSARTAPSNSARAFEEWVMRINPVFQADVQKAYGDFNEGDYDADFGQMPVRAQDALEKFAGSDDDVAEFATKTVDGRPTFAAMVPSDDVQDIRVVDGAGRIVADGQNLPDDGSVSWN